MKKRCLVHNFVKNSAMTQSLFGVPEFIAPEFIARVWVGGRTCLMEFGVVAASHFRQQTRLSKCFGRPLGSYSSLCRKFIRNRASGSVQNPSKSTFLKESDDDSPFDRVAVARECVG